jgi:hypothetical protein
LLIAGDDGLLPCSSRVLDQRADAGAELAGCGPKGTLSLFVLPRSGGVFRPLARYPQGEANGYMSLYVLIICMVWCFSGFLVWCFSGLNSLKCGVSAASVAANPLFFNIIWCSSTVFWKVWCFSGENFRKSQGFPQWDGLSGMAAGRRSYSPVRALGLIEGGQGRSSRHPWGVAKSRAGQHSLSFRSSRIMSLRKFCTLSLSLTSDGSAPN